MLRRLGQFLPIVCQAKPLSWSTPRSAPSSSPAPDTQRPSQAGLPFAKPNEDASFGDERAFSEPRSQAVVPDGEAQMMASEKGQLGKGGPDVQRAPKTTLCLLDHATWCRVGHTKKKKNNPKTGSADTRLTDDPGLSVFHLGVEGSTKLIVSDLLKTCAKASRTRLLKRRIEISK